MGITSSGGSVRPGTQHDALKFRCISCGVLLYLIAGFLGATPSFASKFLVVGTGGVTGVYYPTGGAICRIINGSRKDHGIRCSVEATAGSVYNAHAVGTRDLDLGIVQSDVQYAAYHGDAAFEGNPIDHLRVLMSLHDEPLSIVVSRASGIATLNDLEGKRVNIGNPGSGQRSTMEALMAVVGWTKESFSETMERTSRDQAQALCDGLVDAIGFTAGHPNASIRQAVEACDGQLINIPVEVVKAMTERYAYYAPIEIDGGLYEGHGDPIETFGVKAALVGSEELPQRMAYAITKAVFENLESLRALHPSLGGLQPDRMAHGALSIPLHQGALRYFEEAGLR